MKRYSIIVAGGAASRFGGQVPKQFHLLAGKPVLFYSLEKFHAAGAAVVVVLPPGQDGLWERLCREHGPALPHAVVTGGATRTASVRRGLAEVTGPGLVAVHDAARPLASAALIGEVFDAAAAHGAAVPVTELRQALRRVDGARSHAVDRSQYRQVQTPQCFDAGRLRNAYAGCGDTGFADDASLFEAAGHDVFLVAGEHTNLKITTPADLLVAETFLQHGLV